MLLFLSVQVLMLLVGVNGVPSLEWSDYADYDYTTTANSREINYSSAPPIKKENVVAPRQVRCDTSSPTTASRIGSSEEKAVLAFLDMQTQRLLEKPEFHDLKREYEMRRDFSTWLLARLKTKIPLSIEQRGAICMGQEVPHVRTLEANIRDFLAHFDRLFQGSQIIQDSYISATANPTNSNCPGGLFCTRNVEKERRQFERKYQELMSNTRQGTRVRDEVLVGSPESPNPNALALPIYPPVGPRVLNPVRPVSPLNPPPLTQMLRRPVIQQVMPPPPPTPRRWAAVRLSKLFGKEPLSDPEKDPTVLLF